MYWSCHADLLCVLLDGNWRRGLSHGFEMPTAFPESGVSGWLVFSSCYLVILGLTRNLSFTCFVDVASCWLVIEGDVYHADSRFLRNLFKFGVFGWLKFSSCRLVIRKLTSITESPIRHPSSNFYPSISREQTRRHNFNLKKNRRFFESAWQKKFKNSSQKLLKTQFLMLIT